jgi:integrase
LDKPFNFANYEILRKCFKSVFPNHIIYDLRTTFYSRCDEFGVSVPARDEFVGHSNGALTNAYRDLSDDYLLKEGEKLNKWV